MLRSDDATPDSVVMSYLDQITACCNDSIITHWQLSYTTDTTISVINSTNAVQQFDLKSGAEIAKSIKFFSSADFAKNFNNAYSVSFQLGRSMLGIVLVDILKTYGIQSSCVVGPRVVVNKNHALQACLGTNIDAIKAKYRDQTQPYLDAYRRGVDCVLS